MLWHLIYGILNLVDYGIISHKNTFKGKEIPNTVMVLWLLNSLLVLSLGDTVVTSGW